MACIERFEDIEAWKAARELANAERPAISNAGVTRSQKDAEMSPSALVTGGAGFMGSHLAEALLERGHHVTVVDNLSTGRFDNIAHLTDHPRFRFAIDTITNEAEKPGSKSAEGRGKS
jgi:hypothetical protein